LRGNSVIIWWRLLGCIVPRLSVAATQNPNAKQRSVATLAQQGIDKNLAKRGRG
jgi:hypothetical protein